MTITRACIQTDDDGSIYTLTAEGAPVAHALEASVRHDGLTYSRDFALDGTPATTNQQLARARAWCKAMTADLASRAGAAPLAERTAS